MTHKIKLMSRLMATCLPTPCSSHTRARIDLAVAAVMAHDRARWHAQRPRAAVYFLDDYM
jgi:hypothetical protein